MVFRGPETDLVIPLPQLAQDSEKGGPRFCASVCRDHCGNWEEFGARIDLLGV